MKPTKEKAASDRPSLRESKPSLVGLFLKKEIEPFTWIMVTEVIVALLGLYLLVFEMVGLSVVSYAIAALALTALYEHGRGLWRKRRWAYGVCVAYGVFVFAIGAVGIGWFFYMLKAKSFTASFWVLAQSFLFMSGGSNFIKKSLAAMQPYTTKKERVLEELALSESTLDGGSSAEQHRHDREDDESDEEYLSDTGR